MSSLKPATTPKITHTTTWSTRCSTSYSRCIISCSHG